MTRRVLPRAEWAKLAGTPLETLVPYLPPEAQVLVIEDGDAVIGTWSAFPMTHLEGFWIAPAHRGRAGVARGLLAGMRRLCGPRRVLTAATDDALRAYLDRLGAEVLPGTHYVWPLDKESSCPLG